MKQTKRILAVLLTAVLLCGAAPMPFALTSYAAQAVRPAAPDTSPASLSGQAVLNAAMDKLPDAVNLYYYTDEAILWVADALGGGYTDADAFIEASKNGYTYVGAQTDAAMAAAAAKLEHLATPKSGDTTTLNGKENGVKPNRDESKAYAKITVVPVAVNGEDISAANRTAKGVRNGDRITFDVYGETDYYVSSAIFPIFFDTTKFAVVDFRNRVKEWDTVSVNGLLDTSKTSDDLIDNYDIECSTVDGLAEWYAESSTDAFKENYKYLLCEVGISGAGTSTALKFQGGNSYLFSFTLSAKDVGAYDGSVTTDVGTIEEAYVPLNAAGEIRSKGISVSRAAGYLTDGVTPAVHGANDYALPYAWMPWDTVAYGGQSYTAENATVVFGTAAHEHTYDEGQVTTEPTCTEKGVKTFTCTDPNCDKSTDWQYTEEIAALGHDFTVAVETVDPTCVDDGYTTYKCVRCDATENRDIVAATGTHDFGEWAVTTEPTCTAKGEKTRVCSRCGATETEPVDASGHKYASVVTEPTCTAKGYTTYTCSVCGDSYTSDETNALDHDFGAWAVTTEPTCTAKGEKTRVCSRCGATETEPVDASGHKYASAVTAPTCTAKGYTTYTCSVCGDSYVTDYTDMIDHTYTSVVVTAPTCTAEGYTTYTCSACGNSVVTDKVPAVGHDFGDWIVVVEPTIDKQGVERRVCKHDPAHIEERAIPAIGNLILKDSFSNQSGNELNLTIPYTRRKSVATSLTAEGQNLRLVFESSNAKILSVDSSGNVSFTRMRPCKKTATITVKDQFDRTAHCTITVKYRWYHYILWVLFGCLWF